MPMDYWPRQHGRCELAVRGIPIAEPVFDIYKLKHIDAQVYVLPLRGAALDAW